MKHRIERINHLIQQSLGEIILTQFDALSKANVTIRNVETTRDLKISKVYYSSLLNDKDSIEIIKNEIKKNKTRLQYLLGKKISLKYMPELHFFYDDTLLYAEKIERIFKKIHDDTI